MIHIQTNHPPRKRARLATHATEQVSVSCSRCKEKKIKCDFDIPMCRPCFKTGSACVIMDTSSGNVYTREQVLSLQKDIDKLQDELRSRGINVREVSRPDSSESWRRPPPNIHSRKTQIRHISKFIGDESGTGFIQHILRAIRRSLKDANFPHSSQEIIFGPTLTEHPAHALPNEADGKKLIDAYLTGFHVQHTFLQRKVVLNLYKTVYQHAPTPMEPSEKQFPQQKKDLFQLNMIFALASIDLHRRNESNKHPFGYFTAALLNLNGILGFETIEDIQGFLLIAQFGLYYYIGCSVWELCQICIRICIELGLHRPPRVASPNLLTEQMRRRVFWECYQLDRISSVALGRPFGIEDSAIEIDTPFDADDEYLEQISYCNQNISTLTQSCSKNGEVAVFNCYIRLRNVAGRIYRALHSNISNDSEPNRKPTPRTLQSQQVPLEAGDAYQLFCEFYSELKSWSLTCPVFQEPSCLAQTPEWFSFLYDREKLTLIQAVIDRVHSRSAFPPKELLNPCHNIAVAIIHKYNDLRKRGQVTYSWSYLQLILSCGLSVIFCVLVKLDHRRKDCAGPDRSWLSNRWTGLDPEAFKDFSIFESSAAIDECTEVHTWMAESSREMGRYARFFDMMRRGIQERIKHSQAHSFKGGRHGRISNSQPSSIEHFDDSQMISLDESHRRYRVQEFSMTKSNTHACTGFNDQGQPDSGRYFPENPNENILIDQQNTLAFYPNHSHQLPSSLPTLGAENTFEPLVRQVFGDEPSIGFREMEYQDGVDNCSWDFLQNPLLAEFTSGLEGYM